MDINSFVGLTVFKCFIRTSSLPNEFQDNIIISPIPAMYGIFACISLTFMVMKLSGYTVIPYMDATAYLCHPG